MSGLTAAGRFETPAGVAKFTTVSLGSSALFGATIGIGATCLMGSASWSEFIAPWITWWLRDASGLLVVAPAIVLWATDGLRAFDWDTGWFGKNWASGTALFASCVLGFVVFSPLLELTVNRGALSMLAVFPLLWAALRCGQRETAACTVVLTAFVVWGAWSGNGPFGTGDHKAFLIAAMIVISVAVLGLILSADIAQRQRVKAKLSLHEQNLRAVLSHADVGIAEIDTTGRFKLVNSRYCDIVHRPAAELLQLRVQDLLQADDGSQMLDALGQTVRTGETLAIENKIVLSDGAPLWIKNNVAPISDQTNAVRYLVTVAEDVTARRCLPNGCVAEVVMDDNLLKQLRSGATATFIIFQTPEEGIGFPLSLKGFGEGFDKLS